MVLCRLLGAACCGRKAGDLAVERVTGDVDSGEEGSIRVRRCGGRASDPKALAATRMYVRQFGERVRIDAPAKVNLSLEVLARRSDGFHEIETLMVAIGVWDTLQFASRADGQIHLACRWATGLAADPSLERGELPGGPENIVVRAVLLLRAACGCRRRGRHRSGQAHALCRRIGWRVGRCSRGPGGGESGVETRLAAQAAGGSCGRDRQRCAVFPHDGCGNVSRAGRTDRAGSGLSFAPRGGASAVGIEYASGLPCVPAGCFTAELPAIASGAGRRQGSGDGPNAQ